LTIEEILEIWEGDSRIDRTELGDESVRIPKLHHKYYTIYIQEKLRWRALDAKMKQLKLDKYEFYTQGHTEETKAKNWTLPARGMILKADVPMYMESDVDMIDLSLKIGMQEEKIHLLDSIIKGFKDRGFLIKNCIESDKFRAGA
jgi:hypothetical protein